MTEPNAGSDLRSMKTRAERDGDDYVINGTKHFISYADVADFIVLFAASGVEETASAAEEEDHLVPGRQGHAGPRGAHGAALGLAPRLPPLRAGLHRIAACTASQVLGEEHRGFDVANQWLGATRLTVAAQCVGRAQRALEMATAMGGHAQAVRPDHRQVPGHQLQARRHGDRDRRRRAAGAAGRLEDRPGHASPTRTTRWPSSTPPRCWRASPTRRRADLRRHGPDGGGRRSSGSGATPGSSASGTAPRRSSATSSRARCCGRTNRRPCDNP